MEQAWNSTTMSNASAYPAMSTGYHVWPMAFPANLDADHAESHLLGRNLDAEDGAPDSDRIESSGINEHSLTIRPSS